MRQQPRAFTLIELLVVVAIIAILAAIAVPNLLAAQLRAKVSRAQAELKSMANALEIYRVDNRQYPPNSGVGQDSNPFAAANPVSRRLQPLTTPVSYIHALPADIFRPKHDPSGGSPPPTTATTISKRAKPVKEADKPAADPGAFPVPDRI